LRNLRGRITKGGNGNSQMSAFYFIANVTETLKVIRFLNLVMQLDYQKQLVKGTSSNIKMWKKNAEEYLFKTF
jgi:hypothetical protein